MLKQNSAVELIGAERVRVLTKLGSGKNAKLCLELTRKAYEEQRFLAGYKP